MAGSGLFEFAPDSTSWTCSRGQVEHIMGTLTFQLTSAVFAF